MTNEYKGHLHLSVSKTNIEVGYHKSRNAHDLLFYMSCRLLSAK